MSLEQIESYVEYLLRNASNFEWTVHGLGFLRLYVSNEQRVHVWNKSLMTPNVTQVHDHPWHFNSLIVRGYLRNHLFRETDKKEAFNLVPPFQSTRYIEHVKQQIHCGEFGCEVTNGDLTMLADVSNSFYRRGDEYYQSKFEIHRTEAQDGTVTMISRTFEGSPDLAHVYFEPHVGFISAEFRKATKEEIERVARHSLERWWTA